MPALRQRPAKVMSIHFWPVSDYIEQIEIFSKKIIPDF